MLNKSFVIIVFVLLLMKSVSYSFSLSNFINIDSPNTPPQIEKPINVTIDFSIEQIDDINQIDEVITVVGCLHHVFIYIGSNSCSYKSIIS